MQKRFLLITTISILLITSLLGYFFLKPAKPEIYFDLLNFKDSIGAYGYYSHPIKNQEPSAYNIGNLHNFYILSNHLPYPSTPDVNLITDAILDSGWKTTVNTSNQVSENIPQSAEGLVVSSGSYTNQFRQNSNLLILNIEAIVAPPVERNKYIKLDEDFIWNIKVIEIPDYF